MAANLKHSEEPSLLALIYIYIPRLAAAAAAGNNAPLNNNWKIIRKDKVWTQSDEK